VYSSLRETQRRAAEHSGIWDHTVLPATGECHRCYLSQVNTPPFNPSRAGQYSIYLPLRDKKLSWPWWWLYA